MGSSGNRLLVMPIAAGLILATFLSAGPAAADRHCAPALEQYFSARHAILSHALLPGHDRDAMCQAGAAEAVPHLEEAAAAAGNCGCDALRERIDDAVEQARSTADCPSRIHGVLAVKTELEQLAQACH